MHLVIYFCGTGNPGDSFLDGFNYRDTIPHVKMLFVGGCEQPDVCNASLSPNLHAYATRFIRLFKQGSQAGILKLTNDPCEWKGPTIGIGLNNFNESDSQQEITGITLCGYSRGAVTCFEVARELYKLDPALPVDLVADQPVPGNMYQLLGTNAASVADCSKLTNLKNVSIILGAYTGKINTFSGTETHYIHRGFFSQIIPKLPKTIRPNLIIIPKQHHNVHSSIEDIHLQIELAQSLFKRHYIPETIVQSKIDVARKIYGNVAQSYPAYDELQRIFGKGISRENYNWFKDKLHPTPHLRDHINWSVENPLIHWWHAHEQKASTFSTGLTKKLLQAIRETDSKNANALTNLYREADKWLILKDGVPSSRYYQVEALRNNIYDHLIKKMNVDLSVLQQINHDNLIENNYFSNHWSRLSNAASLFKTQNTKMLDEAFKKHAKKKITTENLVEALTSWQEAKMNSQSKRLDLVIRIQEQLQTMNDSLTNELQSIVAHSKL